MLKLAKLPDLDIIFDIDKKFYKDTFFTKNDLKNIINGKSRNKLYISSDKKAYLMTFKMPDKSMYITSLAGTKASRKSLLTVFLKKQHGGRIYTHGKEAWGMDLLKQFGFKKRGRGNLEDELVEFGDDITKLWVYELWLS
jgi:hypothetical protein